MRKSAERLSLPPGGWLHVVHIFAFSKMRADKLNVCENVCAACGKTQLQPPPHPTPARSQTMLHFEALYLSSGLLRQRVVNKLLGRDARKTVAAWRTPLSALHPTPPKKKALQETTTQEPFHSNKYDRNSAAHYLSSTTHSLSVSSNEQEQCRQCVWSATEQEAVPLNWG